MRRKPNAKRRGPRIVLLTDFGPGSAYVGQVKLVLARFAPGVQVLDLAHDLAPHAVSAAALSLESAWKYLPVPCVVLAVIDPGVGSTRRILAARYAKGSILLVPDNGILPGAVGLPAPAEVRIVNNEDLFLKPVSPVFHGRDIFAPLAGRLATGLDYKKVGPRVQCSRLAPAPWCEPVVGASVREVRVIHVDRFGNLITNLCAATLGRRQVIEVRCRKRRFPFGTHYRAVGVGDPLSLIGSHGHLELALREASAAEALKDPLGAAVRVRVRAPVV